jgi:hypothetical protein
MVLAIEPRPMPSPKASSHWKVKEVGTRAGLETHPSDNLAVSGARLVFQEDVIFEQRKIRGDAKKCLAKMDKYGYLKNGVRIEVN